MSPLNKSNFREILTRDEFNIHQIRDFVNVFS